MMSDKKKEILNERVLALIESMYGDISPNFRKIWITLDDENVTTIHIMLEKEDKDDLEAIEDFIVDFEAIQPVKIRYDVNIVITDEEMNVVPKLNCPHRYVYIRRERRDD